MNSLRFDGQVAVVTGAGRGLGRAYGELLAQRGASVIINDIGVSATGQDPSSGPASEVVAAIIAGGGSAVVDTNDVSSVQGADALIRTALEHFGRVDIVINNAGIIDWAGIGEVDVDNIERHLAVHVMGSFNTVKAAWPTFVEQGYGRIVMTTSAGVFGLPKNLGYATAKGGVIGMTRSIATVAQRHGIAINCIAPAAVTRMGGSPDGTEAAAGDPMAPGLAAPLVAYLAHAECAANGEIFAAGAGRFSRIVLSSTEGYVHEGTPSMEDIAEHWGEINAAEPHHVPIDLMDWSTNFTKHLRP